ncbi:uncharacterized protein Dmoj_GI11392 [Drosophila mojavensis]|uniref:Uncharacterized protein n=1 Tax=Drosophila mojavensis TaxID=7230 RepID=B4KX35_DROMO|nr:uncharacterized protein Dmoj_GI11392 [Drosophila mojavensis]
MDYHDTKLNADIDLIKQLQSGLRLSMDFSTRRIRSSSFTHFYEYSLDLCNMLSTQKNNIFKRWFSTFYNYGNFKRACPVPPNYYYLKNYRISELEVPPFLFAGLFRLEFQMIQSTAQSKKKDHIFSCESSVFFQSGECKFNPKFFDNFTISTFNNTVNLEMVTKRSFDRGFNVHADFSIKMGTTNRYQRVFAHTMDVQLQWP